MSTRILAQVNRNNQDELDDAVQMEDSMWLKHTTPRGNLLSIKRRGPVPDGKTLQHNGGIPHLRRFHFDTELEAPFVFRQAQLGGRNTYPRL